MSIRTIIAALSVVPGLAFDMGPTFDADYAGEDYNVTLWHTPPSGSANNYEAAAKACEVGMQDANAFHPVHPASVYATHTHTHTHTCRLTVWRIPSAARGRTALLAPGTTTGWPIIP